MKIKFKITVHIPSGGGIIVLEQNKTYDCKINKELHGELYLELEGGKVKIELLSDDYIEIIEG